MTFDIEQLLSYLASLTVGTLIGTEFSRYFYRPRVIVRYKEIDPNYDEGGVYWSLQIENAGRTVAMDCTANITLRNILKVDVVDSSQASLDENLPKYDGESIDLSTPREQIISQRHFRELRRTSLCWAKLGNPEYININPGVSQSVDVCKFQIGEDIEYFIFPSEMGWRRVRVRLAKKTIKGYILICPSNEFPTRVDIELSIRKNGKSSIKIKKPSMFSRFRLTGND